MLQGVISNYETDLFTPLIKRAAELTGTPLRTTRRGQSHTDNRQASLAGYRRPLARGDISYLRRRLPSNEGRGYVLRKIIRRAITHGRLLGQTKPFLHEMVFAVRDLMQDAYPGTDSETAQTAGEEEQGPSRCRLEEMLLIRMTVRHSRLRRRWKRPGSSAMSRDYREQSWT